MIQFLIYNDQIGENYTEIFNNIVDFGASLIDHTGYKTFNSFSEFNFNTRSKEIRLGFYNDYNATNIIYVIIDGVMTVVNCNYGQNNQTFDTGNNNIKTVKIVNQHNILASPLKGCFLNSVIIDTNKQYLITHPSLESTKILFWGDSITGGSSGTNKYLNGFATKLRLAGRNVAIGGSSGFSIASMYSNKSQQIAWIDSLMDGTTNKLFIMLGTNDSTSNPTTIDTYYKSIIDDIHALSPDILIYCCTPLIRATESNLQAIRDNMVSMVSSRVWSTLVDLKNVVLLTDLTDGLHPGDAGQIKLENALIPYAA